MGALTFHEYVHISGMNMHSGQIWCTHTCARHIYTELLLWAAVHCAAVHSVSPLSRDDSANTDRTCTPACDTGVRVRPHSPLLHTYIIFYGAGAVEPWVAHLSCTRRNQLLTPQCGLMLERAAPAGARDGARERAGREPQAHRAGIYIICMRPTGVY